MRSRTWLLLSLTIALALYGAWWGAVELFKWNIFTVEYPMWQYKEMVAEKGGRQFDAVVLGDSRMVASVNPKLMQTSTLNLALGGSSAIEMYTLLSRYEKSYGSFPKTIVIGFAMNHLVEADTYWTRNLTFDFFRSAEEAYLRETMYRLNDPKAVKVKDMGEYHLMRFRYLIRDPNLFSWCFRTDYNIRTDRNKRAYSYISSTDGHHLFGTRKRSSGVTVEGRMRQFVPSPTLVHYLDLIAEMAAKHGAQVIFTTMPVNHGTAEKSAPKATRQYRAFMDEMQQKHANVFTTTNMPVMAPDFFGDDSHVNAAGAQRTTAYVEKLIEEVLRGTESGRSKEDISKAVRTIQVEGAEDMPESGSFTVKDAAKAG